MKANKHTNIFLGNICYLPISHIVADTQRTEKTVPEMIPTCQSAKACDDAHNQTDYSFKIPSNTIRKTN